MEAFWSGFTLKVVYNALFHKMIECHLRQSEEVTERDERYILKENEAKDECCRKLLTLPKNLSFNVTVADESFFSIDQTRQFVACDRSQTENWQHSRG